MTVDPSRAVTEQTAEIIDLTTRSAEISPELSNVLSDELLSNNDAVRGLHAIAEQAGRLQADQLQQMSPADFDSALASAGSLDEKLALAELQGTLAKHGLTPLNTVEGLIKLREALVQMYRDNSIVPAETRVQAAELRTALGVIEAKHDFVIATEQHRQDLAKLTAKLDIERAEAEAAVERVDIAGRRETAVIQTKLQHKNTQAEYLAEFGAVLKRRRRALWKGFARPAITAALLFLAPLVLVANLVADGPQYRETFVLGAVNNAWDASYLPVRAGVVRVAQQLTGQEPQPTKPVKPAPKKPAKPADK